MIKALITTVPFGKMDTRPLKLLNDANIEYVLNPHKKRLTESQLMELVDDIDVIIAGTEPITDKVMAKAPKLKLISRVGVGLDGVDLVAAKRRNIEVSYTAEAPAAAVAELTLGLMLALLRSVHIANAELHRKGWRRIFGRRISEVSVGIIGGGRIGRRVIQLLFSLGTPRIMLSDLNPRPELAQEFGVEQVAKEIIYNEADIISLHIPLTGMTKNMIQHDQLQRMKPDALIINTSRGGIINEDALYDTLMAGHLGGAAVDVYEQEPYEGKLAEIERCLLTAHMGSMTEDCRAKMETEASEEAVRFSLGKPLKNSVPKEEYALQDRYS